MSCRLLSGNDCGQAACVSRGWRRVLGDDVLWRDLLQRDYGLVAPQGPDGGTAQTFRCVNPQSGAGSCAERHERGTIATCETPAIARIICTPGVEEFPSESTCCNHPSAKHTQALEERDPVCTQCDVRLLLDQ